MDSTGHPLDGLSAEEIRRARAVLDEAGAVGPNTRFPLVALREPPKDDVLALAPGDRLDRRVLVVLLDTGTGESHEAVVSLTRGEVASIRRLSTAEPPYGQPPILEQEYELVDQVVRADPGWRAAMARRGITGADLELAVATPLSAGQFDFPEERGRRMLRSLTFTRHSEADAPWAHPVEGLVAYVDLIERRVIRLVDTGAVPVPQECGNYDEAAVGPPRASLLPLEITQPRGPSFQVEGSEVSWEGWRFRISFNAREGLVLHQISVADRGRRRPVLYRASVAEMVVPYADPSPARFWISYFDVGEYLVGKSANSLELGCDCLGEIRYFDAVLPDDRGEPRTLRNAVCLHEEDDGVLWKHTDVFTGSAETRRSRRLVVSFFSTVGNYDYGYYWRFYLDGTIQLEVKATGVLFNGAAEPGDPVRYATPIAPGLVAPYHQHLWCARLDTAVDGAANAVDEVDVEGVPTGPENPYGNAFRATVTRIASEAAGGRAADPGKGRTWRVVNPGSRNRMGEPVAYALVPEGAPTLLAQPDSPVARRAAFATRHLWVTRYDPAQMFPAGDYPNQHLGGDGPPAWTAADRPLDGQDIVLWHTFGLTHIPRPEDWPVMPVEHAGFIFRPVGFFDRNPALDLPASTPHCAPETGGSAERA